MRKSIAATAALVMAVSCLAGCGMSEEEKAAKAEQDAKAAVLQEEQDTGMKRLTSENLEGAELVVLSFVNGIKNEDTQAIADAVGAPNIFPDNYSYSWMLTNNYENLKDTDLNDIKVKTEKQGNSVSMEVLVNTDDEKNADTYTASYENGEWILLPPSGVAQNFQFTAPTKQVSCGDISFADYVVSAGDNSYSWTYSVPHMLVLEESPVYTTKSNLGTFEGKMYTADKGNIILANMSADQKSQFEGYATDAMNTVFDMLKQGASSDEMSRIILSEKVISECYKSRNEEESAAYAEKLNTVTSVSMSEDDVQTGWPAAFTYRLAGEDAVIMNVKLCIGTSLGDSRKKATITMQNFDGVWKIVNITTKSGENPFVDFSTYNTAW